MTTLTYASVWPRSAAPSIRHPVQQLRDEGGVARRFLSEQRALDPGHREKCLHLPSEGRTGRRLAHHGERPVHRPEARAAAVAQRGHEAAVAVHGRAERAGAHPSPRAPDLDRP